MIIPRYLQVDFLRTIPPIWVSLGPLLAFNICLLATLFFFWLTYRKQPKNADVDLKEHTHFLSPFLKEYWYWLLRPIERLMLKLHMTANAVTLCGFFISCLSAWFFYIGMIGMGGWLMIFGATFDMLDGRIARLTGTESKSGAFFDSVMDRFGEAVVFMGLAGFYRDSWILHFVILALIGSMMVSYTRARGEGVGVDVKTGIMQRPERIVYLGVGSIFSPVIAYLIQPITYFEYDWVTIGAILLIAILTNLSAFYRMRYVINHLGPQPQKHSRLYRYFAARWNNF